MGREEAQPQSLWEERWEAEVHQDLGISQWVLGGSLGCTECPCTSLLTDTCPHSLAGCHGAGGPIVPAQNLRALPRISGYRWWGSSCVLQLWDVQDGPGSSAPCQRELRMAGSSHQWWRWHCPPFMCAWGQSCSCCVTRARAVTSSRVCSRSNIPTRVAEELHAQEPGAPRSSPALPSSGCKGLPRAGRAAARPEQPTQPAAGAGGRGSGCERECTCRGARRGRGTLPVPPSALAPSDPGGTRPRCAVRPRSQPALRRAPRWEPRSGSRRRRRDARRARRRVWRHPGPSGERGPAGAPSPCPRCRRLLPPNGSERPRERRRVPRLRAPAHPSCSCGSFWGRRGTSRGTPAVGAGRRGAPRTSRPASGNQRKVAGAPAGGGASRQNRRSRGTAGPAPPTRAAAAPSALGTETPAGSAAGSGHSENPGWILHTRARGTRGPAHTTRRSRARPGPRALSAHAGTRVHARGCAHVRLNEDPRALVCACAPFARSGTCTEVGTHTIIQH